MNPGPHICCFRLFLTSLDLNKFRAAGVVLFQKNTTYLKKKNSVLMTASHLMTESDVVMGEGTETLFN